MSLVPGKMNPLINPGMGGETALSWYNPIGSNGGVLDIRQVNVFLNIEVLHQSAEIYVFGILIPQEIKMHEDNIPLCHCYSSL